MRFCQRLRGHQILACHPGSLSRAILRIRGFAQVTTEREVKDKAHVLEVVCWAEGGRKCKARERRRPGVWRWRLCQQVRRLSACRKEPRADSLANGVPFSSIRAATMAIETRTNGICRSPLGATLIFVLARRSHIAIVSRFRDALGPVGLHSGLVTTSSRVQRRVDSRPSVDTLYDVILAPCGPCVGRILAIHPKRWPCTTTRWDVVKSDHEEAPVERSERLYAHGAAAMAHRPHRLVHTNVHLFFRRTHHALCHCSAVIHVLHRTMRWVCLGKKAPLREEVGPHVRVAQGPVPGRRRPHATEQQQRPEDHAGPDAGCSRRRCPECFPSKGHIIW
mmetsp:Transcript_86726/g.240553  ORF Transcript_86726/g.240553 Transcript_86726/m.240553 type:complete len:335 (-) Transcript_86726:139-1143(-)